MGVPEQTWLLHDAQMDFTQLRIEHWVQYNLFTWQWWFLLAILLLPWIYWWAVVDKRRLLAIVTMGLAVSATANWMDQVGIELGWWFYSYVPTPIFPQMLPVNYTLLPIGFMLLYQYYTSWKAFIVTLLAMAAILSFGFEPLFTWMGIYQLLSWQYSYSFPIYILIGASHKYIVDWIITFSNSKH
ncbi:hypothetical protein SPSIL_018310 [Sporomusa silvacetica DSM 10669]|uniref:Acyltransferase family protein n=1 Tax=Sporomusa silvacetica DSM 10669 TaxID=1123289 RepID=A0ABZ3IJ55_9FIRM|nr:CBO0543 family protein [Sporomusa silvacetica]OZC18910.1 hypothetical protein SPSIL_25240 [Sporomusa silvacetica DSM 10669]